LLLTTKKYLKLSGWIYFDNLITLLEFQKAEKQMTAKPILDHFQWICGTFLMQTLFTREKLGSDIDCAQNPTAYSEKSNEVHMPIKWEKHFCTRPMFRAVAVSVLLWALLTVSCSDDHDDITVSASKYGEEMGGRPSISK